MTRCHHCRRAANAVYPALSEMCAVCALKTEVHVTFRCPCGACETTTSRHAAALGWCAVCLLAGGVLR